MAIFQVFFFRSMKYTDVVGIMYHHAALFVVNIVQVECNKGAFTNYVCNFWHFLTTYP